jgi:hypothetical protein
MEGAESENDSGHFFYCGYSCSLRSLGFPAQFWRGKPSRPGSVNLLDCDCGIGHLQLWQAGTVAAYWYSDGSVLAAVVLDLNRVLPE